VGTSTALIVTSQDDIQSSDKTILQSFVGETVNENKTKNPAGDCRAFLQREYEWFRLRE
jgi:hypothetical protein